MLSYRVMAFPVPFTGCKDGVLPITDADVKKNASSIKNDNKYFIKKNKL